MSDSPKLLPFWFLFLFYKLMNYPHPIPLTITTSYIRNWFFFTHFLQRLKHFCTPCDFLDEIHHDPSQWHGKEPIVSNICTLVISLLNPRPKWTSTRDSIGTHITNPRWKLFVLVPPTTNPSIRTKQHALNAKQNHILAFLIYLCPISEKDITFISLPIQESRNYQQCSLFHPPITEHTEQTAPTPL